MDGRTVSLSTDDTLYEQRRSISDEPTESDQGSPTPVIHVNLDDGGGDYSGQVDTGDYHQVHQRHIHLHHHPNDNEDYAVEDEQNEEEIVEDGEEGTMEVSGPKAQRLDFWQSQIRQNVRGSYYTIGQALYRVLHTERLLKTANFIKWAHTSFGLTRSTAYEYIRAYRIVQLLQTQDAELPVPSTLSHFRVFNKTKLKDGGIEVTRLWRTILHELPPDSHQKPRTAKEVLSKGKEIMEREKLGEHAQRMNGLLPGRSPISNGRRGGHRSSSSSASSCSLTPVSSVAMPSYSTDTSSASSWAGHSSNEPRAKMSSVSSRLEDMSVVSPALYSPSGQANGRITDAFPLNPHTQVAHHEPARPVHVSTSSRWQHATRSSYRSGDHQQPQQRDYPTLRPAPARRGQRERTAGSRVSVESDDMDEPPALIPLATNHVIRIPLLISMAQRVVAGGCFTLSITPIEASSKEETQAALRGGTSRLPTAQLNDVWHGRIWGNFTGAKTSEGTAISVTRWINMAVEKFDSGEFDEAVLLTNTEFNRDWFQKLMQYPHCFLHKCIAPVRHSNRSNKDSSTGAPAATTPSSVLFYLGPNGQRFIEEFRTSGTIPGVNTWCNYTGEESAP
ncbi:uncharacterized protein LOC135813898 [Sycon ciliatum]|uniref:uncharacterized protein LOC135813898 n=1 Tax=Sycon ciliatum TaxID=27933 RepID=UPI0031F643E9